MEKRRADADFLFKVPTDLLYKIVPDVSAAMELADNATASRSLDFGGERLRRGDEFDLNLIDIIGMRMLFQW